MKLRISDGLVLGADFVTSTQAILAQKGKGKTYCANVEAEELLDAKQQVVVIDPTDAWFGLRSSPDGRSTGYPIVVFGGDHGDVPLEPGGGSVLAEAIVRERFSAIVCTEAMTKGEELRFLGDFLETLYRKNREAMHLFLDEADIIAPQQTFGIHDARTCGATDDIVRRGRKKGIGCTLISQRASALNKNVLSQADMLVALGCSHPLDLDAIEKWVRKNADPKRAKEMMDSLPSLPRGEAWVWNPSQHLFKRITIRLRHTFDSGATPKAGEKKREPKVLAPVDLARLGQSMVDAVQRQKDNDPKLLRAEAVRWKKAHDELQAGMEREVQRQLAKGPSKVVEKTKVVERPVLKDRQLKQAEKLVERASKVVETATARVEKTIENIRATFGSALSRAEQAVDELCAAIKLAAAPAPLPVASTARPDTARLDKHTILWTPGSKPPAAKKPPAVTKPPSKESQALASTWQRIVHQDEHAGAQPPRAEAAKAPAHPPARGVPTNGTNGTQLPDGLRPAHLRILSAIAWWESLGVAEPDFVGVAFVAGTSSKSSAFENNRSRLRAAGYLDYPSSGRFRLTPAGRAITPPPSMPTTNEALHEAVLKMTKSPAVGRLLRVLIDAYPNDVSFEDLAVGAGTSIASSAFENNRSWLRARGLSSYPRSGYARATELLFPEGAS